MLAKRVNPTVLLTLATSMPFMAVIVAAFAWQSSLGLSALLALFLTQTLLVFLSFTPLHEAAHRIASRKPWINESLMLLEWPVFLGNPWVFRRIHIRHHARTNQGKEDPDHFTAARSLWVRWALSFLLIFYYYYFTLMRLDRKEPGWFLRGFLSTATPVGLALATTLWFPERWPVVFWVWIFPVYVGIGLLGFVNTSWPHHPAQETDRYRNTANSYVPRVLQWLMFNQNLHLVHHLRPDLPWYKYPIYLRQNEEKLRAQGAEAKVYTCRKDRF